MWKFWIGLIVFAAVVGGGFGYSRLKPRETENPYAQIPTELAVQGAFEVTLEELGIMGAERSVTVQPPFSGRIIKLVDDGTYVEAGQPVAWMDTEAVYDTLEEQITQLRSIKADLERNIQDIQMSLGNDLLDLESAAASLEFNQLKLVDVNRSLITKETLLDSELIPSREVDSERINVASNKLSTLQSDLDYSLALENRETQKVVKELGLGKLVRRRDRAMGRIGEEQEKLDLAEVKAPGPGIFLLYQEYSHDRRGYKSVSVGDNLDERQIIGTIPDLTSLIVRSQVTESAITRIQPGLRAIITLDAYPELELSGTIATVGAAAIERERSPAGMLAGSADASGLKVFEIKIRLDEIDPRLRPNMTTNVSILLSEREDVVSIPLKCVFNKSGKRVAYVATPDGYERRELTLGERNRRRVIVEQGLEAGEKVFTVDLERNSTNGASGGGAAPSATAGLAGMGR